MKILKYKKQLNITTHLLFWMLSINCWNILFNPGVETSGVIKGLQDYWPELMLLNFAFFLYCLLPFVWLIKSTRKWIKIAFTILFLIPVCYLIIEYLHPEKNRDDISLFTDFFLSGFMYVVVFHVTIATSVYLNLAVLVKRYLTKSQFGIYLMAFIALTIVTAVLNYVLFNFGIDQLFPGLFFISYFEIWELILIVGAYLGFTTVAFLVWQYAVVLIANRDQARNELSALKAQINPHFLFNNLNTIYSMASQNDEKTKDVILQLSDFLRYILYDTSSEFIQLAKEVDIIRTYIELQKARINPEITSVQLIVKGNFDNKKITPLLLLPLAENCFKHGTGNKKGSITIKIIMQGNQLLFTTENNIAFREKGLEDEQGGIGINNVEKRLNLLYLGKHSLHFEEKEGVFSMEMRIEL